MNTQHSQQLNKEVPNFEKEDFGTSMWTEAVRNEKSRKDRDRKFGRDSRVMKDDKTHKKNVQKLLSTRKMNSFLRFHFFVSFFVQPKYIKFPRKTD